jgi:hypothetical protein
MLFREMVTVYFENTNTLCGQSAEVQYVKAGGLHNSHFKGLIAPVLYAWPDAGRLNDKLGQTFQRPSPPTTFILKYFEIL